jgi:hypothetical protein
MDGWAASCCFVVASLVRITTTGGLFPLKCIHTFQIPRPCTAQIYLAHFYIWVLFIAPWVVLFAPTQVS